MGYDAWRTRASGRRQRSCSKATSDRGRARTVSAAPKTARGANLPAQMLRAAMPSRPLLLARSSPPGPRGGAQRPKNRSAKRECVATCSQHRLQLGLSATAAIWLREPAALRRGWKKCAAISESPAMPADFAGRGDSARSRTAQLRPAPCSVALAPVAVSQAAGNVAAPLRRR